MRPIDRIRARERRREFWAQFTMGCDFVTRRELIQPRPRIDVGPNTAESLIDGNVINNLREPSIGIAVDRKRAALLSSGDAVDIKAALLAAASELPNGLQGQVDPEALARSLIEAFRVVDEATSSAPEVSSER